MSFVIVLTCVYPILLVHFSVSIDRGGSVVKGKVVPVLN
jgi:hypothetical protein